MRRNKQRKAFGEMQRLTWRTVFVALHNCSFVPGCGQKYVVKTRDIGKNPDIICRNPQHNQKFCEFSQQITTQFDQMCTSTQTIEQTFF